MPGFTFITRKSVPITTESPVSPDKVATTDAAGEKNSRTRKNSSSSFFAPIKSIRSGYRAGVKTIAARPISVGGPLPGTSVALERPSRSQLNKNAEQASPSEPQDIPSKFDDIAQQAKSLQQRLTQPSHSLSDRPGGATTAWEKLVECFPLLQPHAVPKMQTLQAKPLKRSNSSSMLTTGEAESIKTRLAQNLQGLGQEYQAARTDWQELASEHQQLTAQREALEEKIAMLTPLSEKAGQDIDNIQNRVMAAQHAPSFSPQRMEVASLRHEAERLEAQLQQCRLQQSSHSRRLAPLLQSEQIAADASSQAEKRMLHAASRLHALVTPSEVNDIAGAVLASDITVKHLDFTQAELGRLSDISQELLKQCETDKASLEPALGALVEAHQQICENLQLVQTECTVQQHTQASLKNDLSLVVGHKNTLQQRLTAISGQPEANADELSSIRAECAHFGQLEQVLNGLIAEIGTLVTSAEERVEHMVGEAERVLGQLDVVMRGLHTAQTGIQGAGKAQEALASAKVDVEERLGVATTENQKIHSISDDVSAESVGKLLLHPPGFGASESLRALSRELNIAINAIPANPAADALPKTDTAESLSYALAIVSGGDAQRAIVLLRELRARPTLSMVMREDGAGASSSSAGQTSADIKALFHLMAGMPRGIEVLQSLGNNAGEVLASKQLVALRVYWQADKTISESKSAPVMAWLNDAKLVAAERLHLNTEADPDQHLSERFGERQLGAYNAVRNGYVSNEPGSPYDARDKELRKVGEEWMQRRLGRYGEGLLRGLTPSRAKTPFTSHALTNTAAMAERFGITTHASKVAAAISAAASSLGEAAKSLPASALNGDGQMHCLAVTVLCDHIRENFSELRALTPADFDAIRKRFNQALPTAAAGTTAKQQALPEPLEEHAAEANAMARSSSSLPLRRKANIGVSAESVLRDVSEQFLQKNAEHLSPQQIDSIVGGLGLDASEVQDNFRLSHISRYGQGQKLRLDDNQDLVKFYRPMFAQWGLRNKLKTSNGGTLGLGLPLLPYISPKIVTPLLTAGYSQKQEAFVQFFQPILGFEMMVGESKTKTTEGSMGVAVGKTRGKHLYAGGTATIAATHERMKMNGTVVRFLRARGQDEAQRQNMLKTWESTVLWKDLKPTKSDAGFSGPMEAILSRLPDAVVTGFDAGSVATQGEARASAGARLQTKPDSRGAEYGLGAILTTKAKAQRAFEYRTEDKAAVYVVADKSSTGKQTFSASLDVQLPLPRNAKTLSLPLPHDTHALPLSVPHNADASPSSPDKRGALGGGSLPIDFSFEREFAQHLQKHGLSPFRINDKQDGDLDRHYFGAKEMLAEISANRDQWCARALETLPEVNGTKDTPENRAEAQRLLAQFEKDIVALEAEGKYCQFNVNYSMRPQASARIDGARLVGELAEMLGDAGRVNEKVKLADAVLQQPATWRPLMLIVREKGKEATNLGLNYGLRVQSVATVDGQRTAAQFPLA
ncbi:hypothetical protein [Collimonas sp.]|jgi:hypothetical protein|uniref:hypothetical protein n=1 Tax=Collimonas sp. TaxID=1963772 RepID=UPI002B8DAB96|nr:hypothetical protein [Collimonas sp.]HWW07880.1 hypothetical protein [Collimonas sp.]